MPSIVTHYLFSEDVLQKTKEEIRNEIIKSHKLYNIFAQSFDNFFYYNFLSLKSGSQIRQFGLDAQKEKSNEYFKNIILAIKEQNQIDNPDAMAYLYGSLTHYILDSNCHPFVIYHAGWIDEQHPNLAYRGNHEKIEVTIDAIYYKEKKSQNLYEASLANILLPKQKFNENLKKLLNQAYENTFNQNNIASIYEQSVNQGHTIIKYFVTDHFGIKKLAYILFDFIFFKNPKKYQELSFYIKNPDLSVLNREKHQWCNPTDNTLTSNESFDELYQKALQEALKIFETAYQVIHNNESIETLLEILGNKSYVTGKDWQEKTNMTYFDKKLTLKKNNHE